MQFEARYNQLNAEQKRAVDTTEGPVMVVAGPGSGKTELLSMRVANILLKTDTPASSILCITFTEAAAANMRKRLVGLIGQTAYDVAIHTFHSLGTTIMDRYSDYFFDGLEYLPADDIMSLQIITSILEQLPRSNPFSSYHEEKGYFHARTVMNAINDIKKGGLSPEQFRLLTEDAMAFYAETQGALQEALGATVSKKTLDRLPQFLSSVAEATHGGLRPLPSMHPLKARIIMDFQTLLEEENSKAVTEWKKNNTSKDKQKQLQWKEQVHAKKYAALAEIYASYQAALHAQSLVDFNDMLLRVVEALKTHEELRYNLAEQYLYILIDEFQDTNGIQLELARLLTDTDLPDARPNILAVGDDDQAIYKFQGADIENLLGFQTLFPGGASIVLDKNYRSTAEVLALAEDVILPCEDRLSTLLPEDFPKHLSAANPSVTGGKLRIIQTPTEEEEAIYIVESIRQLLDQGTDPAEIAVLARNHAHLAAVAKRMRQEGVPFVYERSNNILEDPVIGELLDMLDVVGTLFSPRYDLKDDILSRILCHPYWGIPTLTLWKLSRDAFTERQSWLDTMLASENEHLQSIAQFFITVGALAAHEPLERIIDLLTGTEPLDIATISPDNESTTIPFTSPFRKHYFGSDIGSASEMETLAALRGLQKKVRAFLAGSVVLTKDFLEMIALYKQYGLQIPTDDTLLRKDHGLSLMTVHKSKGLEFDHVFLVRCTSEAWNKKKGGNRGLSLPKFLALSASPETESDFRKLFFVALTRAKRWITMTYPMRSTKDKTTEVLSYLTSSVMPETEEYIAPKELLAGNYMLQIQRDTTLEDVEYLAYLQDLVQEYALSTTHLSSFLDLEKGGPRAFVMNHLLRFPQRKQVSGCFGTSMHASLEYMHKTLRTKKTLPSILEITEFFTNRLKRERLSDLDFEKYHTEGIEHLTRYLSERGPLLDPEDIVERNFKQDHVQVGEAQITGKIDCMHLDKEARTIRVTDWKTGSPATSWKGKADYEQAKLWKYRHQLMFYKLLVENSPEYRDRFVVTEGALEFLKPTDDGFVILETQFDHATMSEFAQLVQIVAKKIQNLDFPDTSAYEESFKGTLAFTQDLLDGKV
ncbi:hypothetical protein COW46_01500 [Candidatus Gracilibacteria bacterium CG17_big_fil_post_rev_8_21_14_2_50_48_13]|nr:MAG: hypothetical protein COW46_01500 [Candidatus Gracilibacteria bacterium CG17_big_fil_post_rev_8_21_14_2_50_48_13]